MKIKLNLFRINSSSVSKDLQIKMVNSSTGIEIIPLTPSNFVASN